MCFYVPLDKFLCTLFSHFYVVMHVQCNFKWKQKCRQTFKYFSILINIFKAYIHLYWYCYVELIAFVVSKPMLNAIVKKPRRCQSCFYESQLFYLTKLFFAKFDGSLCNAIVHSFEVLENYLQRIFLSKCKDAFMQTIHKVLRFLLSWHSNISVKISVYVTK